MVQKSKTCPRGQGHSRQTLPSQDTTTSEEMVKLLEEVITSVGPQRRLGNKIHETILAIDSDLTIASDAQCRQLLVKAAYALRSLEEGIQKADSSLC